MAKRKMGIKAKILIIMLLLTGVSFALAAVLTLGNINNLGAFTLESCDNLGDEVLRDSQKALLDHTHEELLSLVVGQAMIANVQLDRLEDEIAMVANLSGRYLLGEKSPVAGNNEKRFLSIEKPKSIFDQSRLVIYSKEKGEVLDNKLASIGRLHPLMKFIYGNQRNLDMLYICTTDGYYVVYPWTKIRKEFYPFNREWYKEAIKANGKNVWVGPYISANDNKIIMTCAKAVKNFKGKIIAVCGLDVTVKEITHGFISSKLLPQGRAFLIDNKGNVLARRAMQSKGMKWYQNLKKENLFESKSKCMRKIAEKMVAGEEGFQRLNIPGEPQLYVAYAPVPIAQWSIGVAVEANVITASVRKAELNMKKNIQVHQGRIKEYFLRNAKIYLFTAITVLALVLVWGLIFSHRITAPILMLKKKALAISDGNFDSGIHLKTGDELERLDKSFDMMTQEITRYMYNVSNTVREREKIEQEFTVAGNIQKFMLPSEIQKVPEIAIEAYLKPAREVSGDFYNYFMVDDDQLFFCVGKVSGKGVPAAMFMAQVMTLMSHLGSMNIKPEKLLMTVNNALAINNKTDVSVTAFCGFVNVKTGEVIYSNAEHVPLIYIHEDKITGSQAEESLALGTDTVEEGVFKRNTLKLHPNDILLFTTNGIDNAVNEKGEVFGEKYLLNSFSGFNGNGREAVEYALGQMENFYGPKFSKSDIAILVIEYKGKEA